MRCGPYRSHTREGLYAYPDLVVVCGPSQYHDQARDVLLNPTVIVEVLSPSTEAFDRGEKFRRYRAWLPALTDYLLVAQDRPLIDHYHRQEDGGYQFAALHVLTVVGGEVIEIHDFIMLDDRLFAQFDLPSAI